MPKIVVGVDGSERSKEALRWALEEARVRAASLQVVHAWTYPSVVGGIAPEPVAVPLETLVEAGEGLLDTALAEIAGDEPGVEIERVVVEGPAAQVLVDAAADADLLVVGSRGHGGFTGLLLGSVSQQCAHHAPCPVVVVRGRA